MEDIDLEELQESFERFERAAAKGHEESIWIGNVVKDVEMEESALREAFVKTEEPLGRYFAGRFSYGREEFDFFKKSAEGGCSWGQLQYGAYFENGNVLVEKDEKVYLEWMEKAVNQNNPWAMNWLGELFRDNVEHVGNFLRRGVEDTKKAVSYYLAGAELGWKNSMYWLAELLKNGIGCEKDLRQAVIWGAKGDSYLFWTLLRNARRALESGETDDLDCDLDGLCYMLGWGLYWYQYESEDWNEQEDEDQAFGNRCLDYYCSCVELQQKSIFMFLLCWNRTTGGVKGPGQMIAQMVWELREDNLVKTCEESDGKEPETKRIKR
jgi:hypothetical protein